MSAKVVAKRYAEALFQLGEEKSVLDQFADELQVIKKVFLNHEQLFHFLKHPRVNVDQKEQLIDKAFQGLHTDLINAIKLLVHRHRIDQLPSIVDSFIQLVHNAKGIAEATVQSVRELTSEEKELLQQNLAKRFNKDAIIISNEVNPDILGGLHIRVGNTLIDGTLSGMLKRIERRIITGN